MQLRSGKVTSIVYPVLGFSWPRISDGAARSKKCFSTTELTAHIQGLLRNANIAGTTYANRLCLLAAMETLLDSNREVIPGKLLYTIFDKLDEGCVYHGYPPDLYKYINNAKRILEYPCHRVQ
jgi:hypothetical protein